MRDLDQLMCLLFLLYQDTWYCRVAQETGTPHREYNINHKEYMLNLK